jgi:hypothetical protein
VGLAVEVKRRDVEEPKFVHPRWRVAKIIAKCVEAQAGT